MSTVACPSCGHENAFAANFCSSCGSATKSRDDKTTSAIPIVDTQAASPADLEATPGETALVVSRGPNAGSKFVLADGSISAGRHPDSDIFLDDITVSRRHVEVEFAAGTAQIRDVGSLNGTYVNRERIEGTVPLNHGDEVQIGAFKLMYISVR